MKLSVVIVNYNVEYFLEQCILSVLRASKDIEVEIFMVDNASVDGSVQMVREKFPSVKVIANIDNVGFSKANNQAMRLSKAEYVLLLNPDTVIEEDTLKTCIEFMNSHPDAGGLGVKMVDGKGIFLPESKRGLPTPETAFYKITGLNKIFPKSQKINRYYLGNLAKTETHEIEILSGAFMFMRNKALKEVGLLDEAFFMYGEDIDLSYRIVLGGYKNYYLPTTSIIHYKGESTKKGSLNYVFVFYNAMVIFAEKHFSSKNANVFSKLINVAIWLRASWSILISFLKKIALPLVDLSILFILFSTALKYYGEYKEIIYNEELSNPILGVLSGIIVTSLFLNKGYKLPWKRWSIIKSVVIGFFISLIVYSVLPDTIRFSRALILISPLFSLIYLFTSRLFLNFISKKNFPFRIDKKINFGIIGSSSEFERVKELIAQTRTLNSDFLHFDFLKDKEKTEKLDDLIKVYKLNEIVFCAEDLSSSDIIRLMSLTKEKNIDFKIAPPESLYIIGSNSIEKKGDLFILDVNSISKAENRKKKRVFDFISSLFLLMTFPLLVLYLKNVSGVFKNLGSALLGKKTLIGYSGNPKDYETLPKLKPSIIPSVSESVNDDIRQKMNVLYARDYKWRNDLILLIKNLQMLAVQKT